ncbi:hypothetical protein FRB93_009548 [Tulasnella sp. JGI-2019a]|nr:hypothetical protein FRB93_009548 [Tulasnella sp. JGI-2019a]
MPPSNLTSTSPRAFNDDFDSLVFPVGIDPPEYLQADVRPDSVSLLCDASPVYCTVSSPPYSPGILANETFLDSSPIASSGRPRAPLLPLHVYRIRSPNMLLTISTRQPPETSTSPAFGRSGTIDADLQVNDTIKPADSIRLIIEGVATCRAIGNGASSSRRLLYHTRDFHGAATIGAQTSNDQASATYSFSFELPATTENSDIPLPPSYYFRSSHVEAGVRYTLRVIWTKKGLLRTNEEIYTVFLYLPRSRQTSSLPPSWWTPPSTASTADFKSPYAYSTAQCVREWNTISLASLHSGTDRCIKLVLPNPLSYQAGTEISFKIMVSSVTSALADLTLDSLHVELVKITTVTINLKANVSEETLGIARFDERDDWMPPCSQVESDMIIRTAHGCTSGGRPQGEMIWNLSGFIQVQYAIRVSFNASERVDKNSHHDQPIELTTDCSHDSEDDEDWVHTPALGLVRRS